MSVETDAGQAKLTQSQVEEIKKRSSVGESGVALADAYGVSRSQISRILNNKRWTA